MRPRMDLCTMGRAERGKLVLINGLVIALLLTVPLQGYGTAGSRQLAGELFFHENDWQHARTEIERLLLAHPDDPALLVMRAICLVRTGKPDHEAFTPILDASNVAPDIRAHAHYELGRLKLDTDSEAAFGHFKQAFMLSSDPALWSRSGFYLHQLHRGNTRRYPLSPSTTSQLRTSSHTWTNELRQAHSIRPHGRLRRTASAPLRTMIRFYQRQVGPAIGSRCSLEPSCSRFAMKAVNQFGWRGIPLIADRIIREPDVVKKRQNPIIIQNRLRFHDPLSAHSSWFSP